MIMAAAAIIGIASAEVIETMILDKNFVGRFKVGKQMVNLQALFNMDATVIYSSTC
jgi:hypothetical protein